MIRQVDKKPGRKGFCLVDRGPSILRNCGEEKEDKIHLSEVPAGFSDPLFYSINAKPNGIRGSAGIDDRAVSRSSGELEYLGPAAGNVDGNAAPTFDPPNALLCLAKIYVMS